MEAKKDWKRERRESKLPEERICKRDFLFLDWIVGSFTKKSRIWDVRLFLTSKFGYIR
jgi:hypothetical protein